MSPFEHTQLGVGFSQGLAELCGGNYNMMHCAECSRSKQNSLLATPSIDGQNGNGLTAWIWRAVEGENTLPQRRGDKRRYTDIREREEMERAGGWEGRELGSLGNVWVEAAAGGA